MIDLKVLKQDISKLQDRFEPDILGEYYDVKIVLRNCFNVSRPIIHNERINPDRAYEIENIVLLFTLKNIISIN